MVASEYGVLATLYVTGMPPGVAVSAADAGEHPDVGSTAALTVGIAAPETTVTGSETRQPVAVIEYTIVAAPILTPVTTPVPETVAIDGALLAHTPPATPSVIAMVCVWHTVVVAALIADGALLIVITFDAGVPQPVL